MTLNPVDMQESRAKALQAALVASLDAIWLKIEGFRRLPPAAPFDRPYRERLFSVNRKSLV